MLSNAFSDRYFCYDTTKSYETKWGAHCGEDKLFEVKDKPKNPRLTLSPDGKDMKHLLKQLQRDGLGGELSSVSENESYHDAYRGRQKRTKANNPNKIVSQQTNPTSSASKRKQSSSLSGERKQSIA
jgi:hypothetical protein